MDTSNEYIKMCEKAEEIQKVYEPTEGDFIWVREEDYWDCYDEVDGCIFVVFDSDGDLCFDAGVSCGRSTDYENIGYAVELSEVERRVWLPRQDQLQDIVRSKILHTDAIGAVWKLYNAVGPNRTGLYGKLRSLEQVWLVFVMEEKYKKVWDGKEWIEAGDGLDETT